jgi:hypothetical protein
MKHIFLIIIFCVVIIGTVHADSFQYGNWTQAGAVPPFSPRAFYGSAVFHDQIFVIGGENPRDLQVLHNDVWSSSDGRNWTELTANATFSPRRYLKVATFNNKLWVIGGIDANSKRNDVWSSTDGRNWSLVTADAGFSPRDNPVVVVFDNKLWVIGGQDDRHDLVNDVWSSSDGNTWTQFTDNAGFNRTADFYLSGVVFDNRIFIIDTAISKENFGRNEIWSSSDGKNWTLVNSDASFRSMEYIPVVVFNDRLWIVGGGNDPWVSQTKDMGAHPEKYFYFNSVWSSADGTNWTLETDHAGFSPRYGMGVMTFQNSIWVLGGIPDAGDVWYMPLLTTGPNPSEGIPLALSSTSNLAVSSAPTHAAIDPFYVLISLIIAGGFYIYYSRAGSR